MRIKKLIEKLQTYNPDYLVFIGSKGGGGCPTCGYGSEIETDLDDATFLDMETKLIIDVG